MLHKDVAQAIRNAVKKAEATNSEFVTLEHLVLVACDYDETIDIVTACGGDVDELKLKLADYLKKNIESMQSKKEKEQPALSLAVQRALQNALIQVQMSESEEVTIGKLMISVMREERSYAVYLLRQQGITRFDIVNYVSHGVIKDIDASHDIDSQNSLIEGQRPYSNPQENKKSPLDSFTTNLNDVAKAGGIDPLVGREAVLERVIQVLCRRTKNNPMLVGEPGVGKTAIATGLAARIVDGRVPDALKRAEIFSLDIGTLLAGTKYRGDFEARMKGILKALENNKNSILFIDEMHTVVGAGAASGASVDVSSMLKPVLQNRKLRCMASTTYRDLTVSLERDQALMRRFQKIDVKPPSIDEAVDILAGLKSHYESFHDVHYPQSVLKTAVELSEKHLPGRTLPDKAIDIMDEVGARMRLKAKTNKTITIRIRDVEEVVAQMAQIPARSVTSDERSKLKNLDSELLEVIFGQDEAIAALSGAIKLSRSGLTKPEKPVGCFLFTGPTGVGKTELCKQLARILGIELLRFDMSEYMEKHTVSRLIGAPPGYAGFAEGGLLTEQVAKHPYSVLLLDEMEKAHPDIANVLLQVMDRGTLTDANGKSVDFRNTIIVMTSNAGARDLIKRSIGMIAGNEESRAKDLVKDYFQPEFINRLDAVIPFHQLSKDVVYRIIDKNITETNLLLEAQKVQIEIDSAAREWIFSEGFDIKFGARPIQRFIDEHVKKPLVDELLFGKLIRGGTVKVSFQNGKVSFTFPHKHLPEKVTVS